MKTLRVLLLVVFAAAMLADDFHDLSARAAAARDANDVSQAIALYRKALDLNPRWQEGWWFLGTLLYDGDQYAAGREAFGHFVDLDAQAGPGWAFLGLCEYETGDYAKALSDVERGVSLGAAKEPQLGAVLQYHEALLLTREGKFDDAIQKYRALMKGMQGKTLDASMLTSIGLAALRVPLVPNDVGPAQADLVLMAGKTAALLLMGDYPKAEAAFNELLAKYPDAPNVHYMRGVYLIAKDPEGALDEFKRELEVSPSNRAADKMLAWGLLTRGDPDEALPYAEKAAQGTSGPEDTDPFLDYLLGRALVETGAAERGLPYLQQAEKADTSNTDIHVTLASAYAQLGQPQRARHERELVMQIESETHPVVQP